MIDLQVEMLAAKKTSKKASSRRPIVSMAQLGVLAGRFWSEFFAQLFECHFCACISGSRVPITLIWVSMNNDLGLMAEVEYS